MKILLLFTLMICFYLNIFAQEIKVSTNPVKPVAGQSFKLIVEVETDDDDGPDVTFESGDIDILGRSTSFGTYSSFVGGSGKISVVKKYRFSFDSMANKPGDYIIKNISVKIGTKIIRQADYRVQVLKEAMKSRDIFISAEPSKTSVYLGEGFNINYYLYYKKPAEVVGYDKFPKLERFLKRIIFDPTQKTQAERVNLNGEIYERVLQYTARLYPLKVGKSYIDSLSLKVLLHDTQRTMFGGFGLSLSRPTPRDINSERIEINVLPIPADNVPQNFTGLVGDHEIIFEINRNKFLVNEPVETKLIIEGPGALENFDPPQLFKNDALEQFDIKSSVNTVSLDKGRKIFEYTYLPRSELTIPKRNLSISFFDPETKSFKEKLIPIPEISASGGNYIRPQINNEDPRENEKAVTTIPKEQLNLGIIAPDFDAKWYFFDLFKFLSYALVFVLLIYWTIISILYIRKNSQKNEIEKLVYNVKKNGITYSNMFRLFGSLNEKMKDESINKLIDDLDISEDAKKYFKEIMILAEQKNYSNSSTTNKIPYIKKFFKELSILRKNS